MFGRLRVGEEVFLLFPYLGAGTTAPVVEAMAPVVGRQIWPHSQLGLSRSEACSAQGRRGYIKRFQATLAGFLWPTKHDF